jgi:hypothetical protein
MNYRVPAMKIQSPISIDGKLDEPQWQQAPEIGNFMQNFPNEGQPAKAETTVKLLYDHQYLYVAAVCKNIGKGPYTISSLRRDFNTEANDAFFVYIDPFDDRTNGFSFSVNPYNVQYEALIYNGSRKASDWDNIWFSKVERGEGEWVVEMAIPFKTLRFDEDNTYWRINFGRNDRTNFERSSWVPVPINFDIASLAFSGYLDWEDKPTKPGANLAFIPYVTGGGVKNYQAGTPTDYTSGVGFDAKVAVTPGLNLDLTFNPDFSQVEVDRQQTNLNRFELFFPERRQFFLENNDLFGDFGFRNIRPFFSRRIGIASDSIGRTRENSILGGARLSGKLNQDWRLGLLNMQTQEDGDIGVPTQNFTVATFQRRVFGRSNIAGIFVNRQSFAGDQTASDSPFNPNQSEWNRVAGFDFNLQSNDNKWSGKIFYHRSFGPEKREGNFAHAAYVAYNERTFRVMWNHERVGEGYNAEVGFVPRSNYWRLEPQAEVRIFPKSGAIFRHSLTYTHDEYRDETFERIDLNQNLRYSIQFKNTAFLSFTGFQEYIMLQNSFDPTRTGGQRLAAFTGYTYTRYGVTFRSDSRPNFNYNVALYNGGFFNGNRLFFRTGVNYRFQPYGNVAMEFEYNKLDFPEPYNSANLFLIGPRVEVSFTDELFLSTFVQYNNQIQNVNINTRFQWRFRPVSDLFIVYTDNYFPENFRVKNRALILKLSYWLAV